MSQTLPEKGSLQLLDRAIHDAIRLEIGEETDPKDLAERGIVPERTRLVAGLKLTANAARDAKADPAAKALLKRLGRYANDHGELKERLIKAGVSPIAFLPLVAWERICDMSGLYRLVPRGDTVRFDGKKILEEVWPGAENEALLSHEKSAKRGVYFFGAVSFLAMASLYFSGANPGASVLLVVGFFGLGAALISWVNGPSNNDDARRIALERIPAAVEKHEQAGTLVSQLWPDLREPEEGPSIRIALPDPPEDVQQSLLAAERAKFKLHVAVVGAAIGFKESVAAVIAEQTKASWVKTNQQALRDSDPIAYVRRGTAVAIIAQYGDFPIEKEVMLQVINSEHLA